MTNFTIFPPSALSIYQDGLACLMNRDWFLDVYRNYLHSRILMGSSPKGLLFRTIHDGILYDLGVTFFNRVFSVTDDMMSCSAETAFAEASALYQLLAFSGCAHSEILARLLLAIDAIDEVVQETPKNRVNSVFRRQGLEIELQDALEKVEDAYKLEIAELRKMYARNFAERAFHDRQLCEYITFGLTEMHDNKGVPIAEGGLIVVRLAKRHKWPSWVLPTLQARERGRCANCGSSIAELQAEPQIDHIVPLMRGGSNDLVNLQLLCSRCNLEKRDGHHLVASSIPEYLHWHRRMRE